MRPGSGGVLSGDYSCALVETENECSWDHAWVVEVQRLVLVDLVVVVESAPPSEV